MFGNLIYQVYLCLLLLLGEIVADFTRSESALRTEVEPVERHVTQCGGDTNMDCAGHNAAFVLAEHIVEYKWGLANLIVSLRLNTFAKINLGKWLNEPFTPPPEVNVLT